MECKDLSRRAYELDLDTKIMVGYTSGEESKRLSIGGRRSIPIEVENGTPVYLLIFSKDFYCAEEVKTDAKGIIRIAPSIEKYISPLNLVDKREWEDNRYGLTHYCNSYCNVFLFEHGFYVVYKSWTDFNQWEEMVDVYLKNGISDEERTLKYFAIHGGPFVKRWKPTKEVHDFITRVLEKNDVSMEEFDSFISAEKEDYYIRLVYKNAD